MGKYDRIDEIIKKSIEANKKLAQLIGEEHARIARDVRNEVKDAIAKEYSTYQKQRVEAIVKQGITDFYNSYPDVKYKRLGDASTGDGGLYNLFSPQTTDDGLYYSTEPLFADLYDPHQMASSNQELLSDGLKTSIFETVFEEGYHGGAKTISSKKSQIWGAHPSPGTPYWRGAGLARHPRTGKRFWHKYGVWKKEAKHVNTPPLKAIADMLQTEHDAVWEPEFQERYTKYMSQANDDIVRLLKVRVPVLQEQVRQQYNL